jgi:hypothetical protein
MSAHATRELVLEAGEMPGVTDIPDSDSWVHGSEITPASMEQLYTRIRRSPAPTSVAGSLPVLFFGEALSARLLTVGLNPSDQEYVDQRGQELEGSLRRFETLRSLGAASRSELSDRHCARAIATMRRYFEEGRPVYRWFRPLARVIDGIGASFVNRTAAHLDLVQEATRPVWSELPAPVRDALLVADLPFLGWQLTRLPARVVACNGATVLQKVIDLTGAEVLESGVLRRIRWTLARAARADATLVGIVGWNYPLSRPTGLGIEGERELGALLGSAVDRVCGSGWRI